MRLQRWDIVQFFKIIFSLYNLEILIYSIITSLSYNYYLFNIYIHLYSYRDKNWGKCSNSDNTVYYDLE